MADFANVTVVKKANIYYEGKVSSRTVLFADGSRKTLGLMFPGSYDFGTAEKEVMEILSGELAVLLPGETQWKEFRSGDTFEVKANARFQLKVKSLVDYCCSYLKS